MISFGTDGWRARMDESFTLENVSIVCQAISNYIIDRGIEDRGIFIGYDTRKNSDSFAKRCAEIFGGNGIKSFFPQRNCPTPVTAFYIRVRRACGAIMITASHNPPEYNGIKFIPEYAGPATKDITDKIEDEIFNLKSIKSLNFENLEKEDLLEFVDPSIEYIKHVKKFLDQNLNIKVCYDPLYGTGNGYINTILSDLNCEVYTIHDEVDPNFGGLTPDPDPENLKDLVECVKKTGAIIGVATDGDADRLGVVDENGRFYNPNQIFSMLLEYLAEKGKKGAVVRTIATTHMLDRIAQNFNLKVYETPVGFKYVGELFREKDVLIGCEESGGFSIGGHIPEKDGILASLLVANMVAEKGFLSEIYASLTEIYGEIYSERIGVYCEEKEKIDLISKILAEKPDKILGKNVREINTIDGLKIILDDAWLLLRPSGTEPLFRIYAESNDRDELKALLKYGKNLVEKT
ncbi:MAG: phosphoglucomutase/phosphomannomutase family protein [Candidatus Hydrothermarchaeota archaeon]